VFWLLFTLCSWLQHTMGMSHLKAAYLHCDSKFYADTESRFILKKWKDRTVSQKTRKIWANVVPVIFIAENFCKGLWLMVMNTLLADIPVTPPFSSWRKSQVGSNLKPSREFLPLVAGRKDTGPLGQPASSVSVRLRSR